MDKKTEKETNYKAGKKTENEAGYKNVRKTDDTIDNQKLVDVKRCTKVVKGGRKFSFAAVVVVGDSKGKVGYGKGKATEVADAKNKATQNAKRNMVRIPLREGRTLHHDITAKYCSGKVMMRAAPAGTGIIAGGALRALFEVLGIKDVVVKSIGSTNSHNMIKAALKGLRAIKSPRYIAEKRGKTIGEIIHQHSHEKSEKPEEIHQHSHEKTEEKKETQIETEK